MPDDFATYTNSPISPYARAAAITPSDGADLADVTRALWVGGAGNVRVDLAGGDNVTLTGVPAGTLLKLRVKRVYATGTTATSLVGLR